MSKGREGAPNSFTYRLAEGRFPNQYVRSRNTIYICRVVCHSRSQDRVKKYYETWGRNTERTATVLRPPPPLHLMVRGEGWKSFLIFLWTTVTPLQTTVLYKQLSLHFMLWIKKRFLDIRIPRQNTKQFVLFLPRIVQDHPMKLSSVQCVGCSEQHGSGSATLGINTTFKLWCTTFSMLKIP